MSAATKPLGLLGDFKNGLNFSSQQMGHGTPLINVKDITSSHRMYASQFDLVEVPFDESYLAKQGDLFFVRSSVKLDGIGLVAKVCDLDEKEIVHCGFVIRFRPTSPEVEPDYLLYLLRSPLYRERIKGLSGGAAIVNVSQTALKGLHVPLPSIETQRRIAAILSAYDDLIENNRRRIQLLEQAARLIYQEWFVRLRYPGHEHVRVVDGVPEGWERRQLRALCDEIRDTVRANRLDPTSPYIGLEHMPRRSITLADWGVASEVRSDKHAFHRGDILFGKIRPYFHKVGVCLTEGVASTDAIVIRPPADRYFSLVLMTVSGDLFVAHATQSSHGSKMPRANWKVLERFPVLVPPEALLQDFDNLIAPTVSQLRTLALTNRKLREARDLLLPKLMSGEIEV